MKIAIIDEGIKTEKLNHPEYIQHQINMFEKENAIKSGNHGTNCAKLLESCTKGYELLDIRMVEQWNNPTNVNNLILALERCIEEKVNFICLSAGTEYLSEGQYFEEIIRKLEKEGICVIASLSNQGYVTLPASYKNILCVIMDWNCLLRPRECIRIVHPFLGEIIVANVQSYIGQSNYLKGNSYAVPIAMGWILNRINKEDKQKKKIKLQDIIKMFQFYSNYKSFIKKDWGIERNNPIIAVKSSDKRDIKSLADILIKSYNLETILIYNRTRQIKYYRTVWDFLPMKSLFDYIDRYVKCHIISCFFDIDEKIRDEINFDLIIYIKEREVVVYVEDILFRKFPKYGDWEKMLCHNIIDLLS